MAEIVNLRQARKAKKRDEKDKRAKENRTKFGRTKASKKLDRALIEKAQRDQNAGKIDRSESDA
ncbi:MAG: DUF4169 family protein [Pseudomonadota bacterium]